MTFGGKFKLLILFGEWPNDFVVKDKKFSFCFVNGGWPNDTLMILKENGSCKLTCWCSWGIFELINIWWTCMGFDDFNRMDCEFLEGKIWFLYWWCSWPHLCWNFWRNWIYSLMLPWPIVSWKILKKIWFLVW